MTGATTIIMLLNILLAASLELLWDVINAQQIVMLLPLFNCVIPANVGIIFKGLMYIAALDVIPTDDIYV